MARPLPTDLPPPAPNPSSQQAALEAIAHTREAALFTRAVAERMETFLEAHDTSPALEGPFILDANSPIDTSRAKKASKSFGIFNPNPVDVYIGAFGMSARPGTRTFSVPGISLIVLPFSVTDVELGVDPAVLAGSSAVVWLWRYETVQAAYLGRGV